MSKTLCAVAAALLLTTIRISAHCQLRSKFQSALDHLLGGGFFNRNYGDRS
jgi:hypothetical protein